MSTTANPIEPPNLAEVNVFDPRWWEDGPPHALFRRLREDAPVRWNPFPDGTGCWVVTSHAEVSAISRDTATYSSQRGGIFLTDDTFMPLDVMSSMLLYMDPPGHVRYRLILQRAFTPHTVGKLEDSIRARVTRTIDRVIEQGSCDLVDDIATPIPLGVLCELMGVPDDEMPRFADWTERTEVALRSSEPDSGTEVFGEMVGYLYAQIERQTREERVDSLVMKLRAAEVDGEQLTEVELVAFFGLLVFAGNDTTRNTTATGMLALLQNPDALRELQADPSLIEQAVEEILRFTTVVQWFNRTATCDTELGGQAIKAGDRVIMWYGAASRDPAVFPDPDTFDIHRKKPDHKAFGGGGRHFCLGSGLARLELRIILEEVVRRLHDLEVAGEVERVPSNWAYGLHHLPVTFTPGPREAS